MFIYMSALIFNLSFNLTWRISFFFGRRLKMIFSFVTKELEISFLWLCILKRNACSLLNTSYNVVTKQFILKSCIRYNFLNRSIENRDPLHRRSARRKTNSISDIAIQKFLITRSISLKKNWIQLQVKKKKKHEKKYTWKVKLSCG